jgi:hypothetical protein
MRYYKHYLKNTQHILLSIEIPKNQIDHRDKT